jgi:hypothetical protein
MTIEIGIILDSTAAIVFPTQRPLSRLAWAVVIINLFWYIRQAVSIALNRHQKLALRMSAN